VFDCLTHLRVNTYDISGLVDPAEVYKFLMMRLSEEEPF